MLVFDNGQFVCPRYIINFPTKSHWRERSKIEDVEAGLVDLQNVIRDYGIKSIAIPPLGCGNGGLDWNIVRPVIVDALNQFGDMRILIYEA
jgi:O-acetyl-ADP-ribose deacetylase (regulator of RNase III)